MKKTAIIYSFNTRKSKNVAGKIIEAFGKSKIDIVNAEELTQDIIQKYDNLIISAPTWFDGELPNYWDEFVPDLEEMDLKGKKVAVFGLGDQKGYPENFCDAVGILAGIFEECGAKVGGHTSLEGYSYESSKAQRGDHFVGLLLDQENQAKKTSDRVIKWVDKIQKEF